MKIRTTIAGVGLLTLTVFAAHHIHQDRARIDALHKELVQVRDAVSANRSVSARGASFQTLLGAAQQIPTAPAAAVATAIPVKIPEAPTPTERPKTQVQEQQIREKMDSTFHDERVDAAWAGSAQSLAHQRLLTVLPEGSEVRAVECRTSLCRIETSHSDGQHYMDFVRKAFLEPDSKLWNGGMFSTPLDDASQAEGRFVAVAYLAKDGQAVPSFEEDKDKGPHTR